MSFPKDSLKSFETEKEIEDKKKVRQAEWEKVRRHDQPLQCPEEPLDSRTLYERLREQKLKEQEEKDEAKKLKNFVRGLEHDEVEFLDQLDDIYTRVEREKRIEEKKALAEFRAKIGTIVAEPNQPDHLSSLLPGALKRKDPPSLPLPSSSKKSQKDLLSNAIRIKGTPSSQTVTNSAEVTRVAESQTSDLTASSPPPASAQHLPEISSPAPKVASLVAYDSASDSD